MKFLFKLSRFDNAGLVILRLALAVIFLVHGTMKWSMWSMQPSEQLPASMLTILRILSIAEPTAAICLILGFLTPVATFGLSIVMIGAINLKMNIMNLKFMERQGSGWEFEFLILFGLVCLFLSGAGKFSLDRLLFRKGDRES